MPYQEFKALLLERLGCTCVKTTQTVWRNLSSDKESPRAHLTPIIRGINRLTNNLKDTKEFIMECSKVFLPYITQLRIVIY